MSSCDCPATLDRRVVATRRTQITRSYLACGAMICTVILMSACVTEASLQATTSRRIKCAAANVQISEVAGKLKATSWKAICRENGSIYRCTSKTCNIVQ